MFDDAAFAVISVGAAIQEPPGLLWNGVSQLVTGRCRGTD